ncbi:MAG TPA: hypothetical protein VJT82_02645 [Pyrinomonadaceae bacterium]|nr:hypothetical protein [Pyrinomonadaceae bacterium]
MSDAIWETFDSLFKTVHRQGRRVEELEARISDLERRLAEQRTTTAVVSQVQPKTQSTLGEMPTERAA